MEMLYQSLTYLMIQTCQQSQASSPSKSQLHASDTILLVTESLLEALISSSSSSQSQTITKSLSNTRLRCQVRYLLSISRQTEITLQWVWPMDLWSSGARL